MAYLKNYSLCNQFKCLSKKVFRHLEKDSDINFQTSEETITDCLVRQLKIWKNNNQYSQFDIKSFTKLQEAKNGADFEWDWYFIDSSGKKWLGFRVQAKVLNLKSQKFLSLDHHSKNFGYGHQLTNLSNVSYQDNRIPFYCFYLYKQGESPLKGCSLASLNNIRPFISLGTNKNAIKRQAYLDDILKISFPWHKLFCFIGNGDKTLSLPDKVSAFLRYEDINIDGNIKFLEDEHIEEIKRIIDGEDDNIEILPRFITIFQDNKHID